MIKSKNKVLRNYFDDLSKKNVREVLEKNDIFIRRNCIAKGIFLDSKFTMFERV